MHYGSCRDGERQREEQGEDRHRDRAQPETGEQGQSRCQQGRRAAIPISTSSMVLILYRVSIS